MEVIIICYMPPIKMNNKNKYKKFQHEKQLVKMSTTFQGKCHYNFMLQECNIRILYLGMSVAFQTTATAKLYDNYFYSVRCMYIIMHFNLAQIDKIHQRMTAIF